MNRKQYRAKYYREKYHNDKDYKEYIKKYNKNRYHRLTINCINCNKRHNIKELENMHFEVNNMNFVCPNCLPENNVNQMKSNRGRKKISHNNINAIGDEYPKKNSV